MCGTVEIFRLVKGSPDPVGDYFSRALGIAQCQYTIPHHEVGGALDNGDVFDDGFDDGIFVFVCLCHGQSILAYATK